ncbi:FAD-dependent oxidoreductase [Bacillus sp. CB62A.1]
MTRRFRSARHAISNGKENCKILGTDHVEGIQFEDGEVVDCDLIVMAVGIRPNTQIAKDAGLIVNRGIVVNDYMLTNDESIYAVGEVQNMTVSHMDLLLLFMNKVRY